ncbi:hypothetical protein [Stella sp.]|uniref:hypothetical protein n=1 Tax=Stella sp. TaxID=2912054 RepID=UPI0035B28294
MPFLLRLLAVVLALALPAAPALAEAGDEAAARGVVELAGKLVPLPPGEWVAVADTVERRDGDGYATRVLVRIAGNVADALVIARANLASRPAPLAAPSECSRTDLHLAHVAYDTPVDGLCLFVNHVVLGDEVPGPVAWLMARERLARLGVALTDTWLTVGIRARTVSHAVDLHYYFAPPDHLAALPSRGWADSRWAPERIQADADRRASLRRLTVWAVWAREAVEQGLRGQVPDRALPPSPWDGPDLARRLTERRVEQVDALLARGLIGAEEHRRQRALLARVEFDPDGSAEPLWRDRLWQDLSQRLASVAESLGISYLVLGSLWPSVGFAVLLDMMAPVGTYLQEWMWPTADARPAPRAPADFGEIGHSG